MKDIILIHGAGLDKSFWPKAFLDSLKGKLHLINLPCRKKTRKTPNLKMYVDAVISYIKKKQIKKPICMGHSMGALVTQQIALEQPKLLSGIILMSTGAKLKVHPHLLKLLRAPLLFPFLKWTLFKWVAYKIDPALAQLYQETFQKSIQRTLLNDFEICDNFNAMKQVKKIALPTLILVGEKDFLAPVKYSQYLHQQIADSKIMVYQGAHHLLPKEIPQQVAKDVNDWMKG